MKKKLTWVVLFSVAMGITALYHATKAHATGASGFTSTTLALGRFGNIDVFNSYVPPNVQKDDDEKKAWISLQKTKGDSDLYIQSNVWQVGGSTGWHTHLGHSLIIVTSGAITAYEGDDPTCTPTVYTQGMGFVDPGHGHVHIVRNEGTVAATAIAVQMIPAGTTRRIDIPTAPGNCPF